MAHRSSRHISINVMCWASNSGFRTHKSVCQIGMEFIKGISRMVTIRPANVRVNKVLILKDEGQAHSKIASCIGQSPRYFSSQRPMHAEVCWLRRASGTSDKASSECSRVEFPPSLLICLTDGHFSHCKQQQSHLMACPVRAGLNSRAMAPFVWISSLRWMLPHWTRILHGQGNR